MPAVKNVGEPCAGEPHARFDGGGRKPASVGHAARRPAPPAYPTNLADGSSDDSGGSSMANDSCPPQKTILRLAETLRGYEFIVRVSGPATGSVRVSYTGRYRGLCGGRNHPAERSKTGA